MIVLSFIFLYENKCLPLSLYITKVAFYLNLLDYFPQEVSDERGIQTTYVRLLTALVLMNHVINHKRDERVWS